ncbi:sulfite exporter TauE/SafE family protein [Humitalea sp. 24SJ18S-53]|uniref:sulfite exporter TauE/SafE family protein n=1 Tax=Humitalea sp. 24SJ18S-53 TaxID=3422307 RepID=UPI003D67766F
MLITDPLFYALAIPAFLLTGMSKGGFASGAGNLTVPLLSLVIPAPQAAGIALPMLCAMDLSGLRAMWGKWSTREMRAMLPGVVIGITLGGLAFGAMPERVVKGMIGLVILAFLSRTLWQKTRPVAPPRATPSRLRGGFWGMCSGFTSTIAHAGGPPAAIYLYPLGLERQQLMATTIVFFGIMNYLKLIPYFLVGQLNAANLMTALVLLPLAPIGVYFGIWLGKRINDRAYYRLLYTLLAITGAKLLVDGVMG